MKDADLNLKTEQLLSQFEHSHGEVPNAAWNDALMQKIAHTPMQSQSGLTATKVSLIALLFIVLNVGFCLKTYSSKDTTDSNRNTELTTISNELLIPNSTTTN